MISLDLILDNLGVTAPILLLLILACIGIVLAAIDPRISVMFVFMGLISEFIIFYSLNALGSSFNLYPIAAGIILCFIFMALLILDSYKSGQQIKIY